MAEKLDGDYSFFFSSIFFGLNFFFSKQFFFFKSKKKIRVSILVLSVDEREIHVTSFRKSPGNYLEEKNKTWAAFFLAQVFFAKKTKKDFWFMEKKKTQTEKWSKKFFHIQRFMFCLLWLVGWCTYIYILKIYIKKKLKQIMDQHDGLPLMQKQLASRIHQFQQLFCSVNAVRKKTTWKF